jgi:hypothetical protein
LCQHFLGTTCGDYPILCRKIGDSRRISPSRTHARSLRQKRPPHRLRLPPDHRQISPRRRVRLLAPLLARRTAWRTGTWQTRKALPFIPRHRRLPALPRHDLVKPAQASPRRARREIFRHLQHKNAVGVRQHSPPAEWLMTCVANLQNRWEPGKVRLLLAVGKLQWRPFFDSPSPRPLRERFLAPQGRGERKAPRPRLALTGRGQVCAANQVRDSQTAGDEIYKISFVTNFYPSLFNPLHDFRTFLRVNPSPKSKPPAYFPHCPHWNADREPGVCGGWRRWLGRVRCPL